jgi:hypothetical protein
MMFSATAIVLESFALIDVVRWGINVLIDRYDGQFRRANGRGGGGRCET